MLPGESDRLATRERPSGLPLVRQTWDKLLFLHWRIAESALRPHVPDRLAIDTFDGSAWITIVPFTIRGSRAAFAPPLPFVSSFHELNVRTYVHLDGGAPGVWFFSLDATSLLAVAGARVFFALPYHHARISLEERGQTISYSCERLADGAAAFRATWTAGEEIPSPAPGSIEFFLAERYCLYAARETRLFRARVAHRPWPLRSARLSALSTTVIEGDGLRGVSGEPLVQAADPLDVEIWGPKRV